ncbi:hypothetical protein PIB30_099884 [Stylosanthes scabra]|uniref:Ubiquitin-like protease family profile domain-containing protein n=1 Tax=Stylosanthes scabra TaxID=79078 RepID=A0ABU6UXU1_9FABA|nr:hypothetical protein [Stylosanthes scabra]
MFDSFETVSLGKDDSAYVVVEGPVIIPSQTEKDPSQPVLQDAEGKDLATRETNENPIEPIEVEPVSINIQIPLELQDHEPCLLTLQPWLHYEAETSTAKAESPNKIITHVLLSMNQEEYAPSFDLGIDQTQPTQDNNQIQQLGDQCKTPDLLHQHYQAAPIKHDLEEICAIWATVENDNKFETIFQLRWPKTLEAMRYNFMTMPLGQCIDLQMVSLMCHVLNREELPRFEKDIYCVPPEILTRMFDTYGSNYLDKKTKLPHLMSELKDQEYMDLLDREKLRTHKTLFVPVLYSHHWWLYVLDVDNKGFYIIDSVRRSLLKKGTISLQLRCVEVPKQPNPTDCGVYVMKWMELLDATTLSGCYTFKCQYNIEEWGKLSLMISERKLCQTDSEQRKYFESGSNQLSKQYHGTPN